MKVLANYQQNNSPAFKMNLACKKSDTAYQIMETDFTKITKKGKADFDKFVKGLQEEVSCSIKGKGVITLSDAKKERGSFLNVSVTKNGKTKTSDKPISLIDLLQEGVNIVQNRVMDIALKK